ncbi:MAG: hypothetical protein JAY74_22000, partial [Candidatus Thiodiazotropha taylori]|nr:hypothetical protein [Candidatus Thiodiazotropha taylori]
KDCHFVDQITPIWVGKITWEGLYMLSLRLYSNNAPHPAQNAWMRGPLFPVKPLAFACIR